MSRHAVIVTDIGYGDAGKGTTVDYLVRQAPSAAVIRHNGGAQAAHNVITPDGRHHTFSQFGSGSFVPGVQTYLSRHMLVNPLNMYPEAEHLIELGVPDVWSRTSVDRDALVITPWHSSANRLRELARGDERHGSCGQGIGETMADSIEYPELALHVGDLQAWNLSSKLKEIREHKMAQLRQEFGAALDSKEWEAFADPALVNVLVRVYRAWTNRVTLVGGNYLRRLQSQYDLLVFEGAQGVLLDEWYGFHPYTTWSTTTHANALSLLSESHFDGRVTRYGVLRAYTTRHGAGPFVTEDPSLAIPLRERHNGLDDWQGAFRYGHLDLLAHRYALKVCGGADALAMTGLDRLAALPTLQVCNKYHLHGDHPDASEFFDLAADGYVVGIKLGKQGDLDHQSRLTELLLSCSPVYQTMSTSGMPEQESLSDFMHTAEARLGLPITIASYGPTAADKRALVAC